MSFRLVSENLEFNNDAMFEKISLRRHRRAKGLLGFAARGLVSGQELVL